MVEPLQRVLPCLVEGGAVADDVECRVDGVGECGDVGQPVFLVCGDGLEDGGDDGFRASEAADGCLQRECLDGVLHRRFCAGAHDGIEVACHALLEKLLRGVRPVGVDALSCRDLVGEAGVLQAAFTEDGDAGCAEVEVTLQDVAEPHDVFGCRLPCKRHEEQFVGGNQFRGTGGTFRGQGGGCVYRGCGFCGLFRDVAGVAEDGCTQFGQGSVGENAEDGLAPAAITVCPDDGYLWSFHVSFPFLYVVSKCFLPADAVSRCLKRDDVSIEWSSCFN